MDCVSIVANGASHVPRMPYRAIFTDTAHDLGLVNMTKVAWEHALGRGYPVLMVFHDIGSWAYRVKYLSDYYLAEDTFVGRMSFALQAPANWKAPFAFNPSKP